MSTGQVGKILGDRWKALSEKQRVPYDEKAATDKKRYETEKAKYQVGLVWTNSDVPLLTPLQASLEDDEDED